MVCANAFQLIICSKCLAGVKILNQLSNFSRGTNSITASLVKCLLTPLIGKTTCKINMYLEVLMHHNCLASKRRFNNTTCDFNILHTAVLKKNVSTWFSFCLRLSV